MKQPLSFEYNRLEHSLAAHAEYVVINWCIGNICNYSCSYCPKGLHDGSSPWPDVDQVIEFCKSVIAHYKEKKLYFEFTGGEVTLWKDLPRLLNFLKSADCRVGIISNGSRSTDYWQKIIPQLDHVCLSYHPESSDAHHFFEIAKMCSVSIRTHINFMMHPDFFSQSLVLAYRVKDLENISIAVQPLTKDMGSDLKYAKEEIFRYTEAQSRVIDSQNAFLAKQIKYVKKFESYRGAMDTVSTLGKRKAISPQRFIAAGENSWKGWTCYAGVEQIVVDMSGNIYRGWCQVGGRLGNIKDKNLRLTKEPVICNKNHCHCNLDIMTTKIRCQGKKKPFWQKFFSREVTT